MGNAHNYMLWPSRRCRWNLPILIRLPILVIFALSIDVTTGTSFIKLSGAGSSFPSEVYKLWTAGFKSYRAQFVHLNMLYYPVGSYEGKLWIENITEHAESIEYASVTGYHASIHGAEREQFSDLQMFPTIAGALVLGFNIPGVAAINLTRYHLVGIYNGTYEFWDDPDIQRINKHVFLPHQRIVPVARSDISGTTELFTSALSAFSPEWKRTFGSFDVGTDDTQWDTSVVRVFATTNHGMTGTILSNDYTIGYMSVADADTAVVKYADLINKAGNIVHPNLKNIQAAMNSAQLDEDLYASLVDADGADAYPISMYSYTIINLHPKDNCDSALELYRFVEWLLNDEVAHEDTVSLHFVPVSKSIIDIIEKSVLVRATCQGQNLTKMVLQQIHDENLSLQTWRTPVFAATGVVILLFICILGYLIYVQININRALWKNEWRIHSDDIELLNLRINKSVNLSKVSMDRNAKGYSNFPDINDSYYHSSNRSKSTLKSSELFMFSSLKVGKFAKNTLILSDTKVVGDVNFKWKTKRQFLWMRDKIHCENVASFYGLTLNEGKYWFLYEYCPKGFMRDIIQNDKYNLDLNLKFSLTCDVAKGMQYLHRQDIINGNLSTTTCYVDHRWTVKISDWSYNILALSQNDPHMWERPYLSDDSESIDENISARQKLWIAPELIKGALSYPNRECDVFSFAIMIIEVFTREDPYIEHQDKKSPMDILHDVKFRGMRPQLSDDIPNRLQQLVVECWDTVASIRPSFNNIYPRLNKMKPSKKSVLDCMMAAIDTYTQTLEDKVEERTAELNITMKELETLLHKMLPPEIATKLSKGESVQPESFESVTIFFSDIVGFTSMCSESSPIEVVNFLNDLYTAFDQVVDRHDVYKVETIGDAYMVISGLPERNGLLHAGHIATMALELAIAVGGFKIQHRPKMKLQLRGGIHTGSVCAGVVGIKMPRYCLFGDTVNTASRMESTSVALKFQLSEDTQCLLAQLGDYELKLRGEVQIKGKGSMKTFWLHGKAGLQGVPAEFRRDII